jgi:hypothetical protein
MLGKSFKITSLMMLMALAAEPKPFTTIGKRQKPT